MSKEQLNEKIADQGQKMIEVQLRFWTNDIAQQKGNIVPKNAWASGVVKMQSNKAHGISPKDPKPFHTMMDLTAIIEKVLIDHGVTLHQSRKMKKYFA